jgi:hypothetical protein
MTEQEDIDVVHVFWIGVNGTLITWLLVVVAQWVYFRSERFHREQEIAEGLPDVRNIIQEQDGLLHETKWSDANKQFAKIPIDRAMTLVLRNSGNADKP